MTIFNSSAERHLDELDHNDWGDADKPPAALPVNLTSISVLFKGMLKQHATDLLSSLHTPHTSHLQKYVFRRKVCMSSLACSIRARFLLFPNFCRVYSGLCVSKTGCLLYDISMSHVCISESCLLYMSHVSFIHFYMPYALFV